MAEKLNAFSWETGKGQAIGAIGWSMLSRPCTLKGINRMLGSKGNPRAENIFAIIKVLQDTDDVRLQVKISKPRAA